MNSIKFICKLKSDLVFNLSTATIGNQETLDFIPGSAILGLVASKLYDEYPEFALDYFHNGKVQFGDAHPLINGFRAIRTPAWWYIVKGSDLKDGVYPASFVPLERRTQMKQCRSGFISIQPENNFFDYRPETSFAIKSAYDSDKRRSEDKKMYGYQSLTEGSVWCFDVRYDDSIDIIKIKDALLGNQFIGKSKSAQYGQVFIEQATYSETDTNAVSDEYCLLYAESRLAFHDRNGQPTFIPDLEQLGILNGTIDWEQSQIRTFKYSPFNGKRKTRDAERFIIEKGSVYCIKKETGFAINNAMIENGIGSFKSEGFGRILVNPVCLHASTNQKYDFVYNKYSAESNSSFTFELTNNNQTVLDFLLREKSREQQKAEVYKKVNEFVKQNSHLFKGDKFASQWGSIRKIALACSDINQLKSDLFTLQEGYLTHGVASEKWKEKGRRRLLEAFIDEVNQESAIIAVVNLSSEMAKKCRKEAQQ